MRALHEITTLISSSQLYLQFLVKTLSCITAPIWLSLELQDNVWWFGSFFCSSILRVTRMQRLHLI